MTHSQAPVEIQDAHVLVVDDIPGNRMFLVSHLRRQGIDHISEAENGLEAMAVLGRSEVDLVLLDVMMPEMDGHQVLAEMRADARLRRVPVIMITALDDMDSAVRCIESGAEDYILKPFNPVLLRARVAATLEKRRLRELEREYLRTYDATTGLPNRDHLLERLEPELARWQRHRQGYGLLVVRLARYRTLLDSLGEGAGDQYLAAQAQRMAPHLPSTAFVGRCGQDAFGVLLLDLDRPLESSLVAGRIHVALSRSLDIRDHQVAGGVQVGIALSDGGYQVAEAVLRDATLAANRADPEVGSRIFDEAMHVEAMTRLELEPALRQAIDSEQLVLHYQPIVRMADGALSGLEALIRWQHPEQGMVPPDRFIRLAEETGLIVPIGRWVARCACRQIRRWREMRTGEAPLTIGINVSAREFETPGFLEALQQSLAPIVDTPELLKIELTETLFIDNPLEIERVIDAIKTMGVLTVLDDFGTGYCSLSYLHQFPFDTLKVDQSFIRGIDTAPRNRKIVASTVNMAHSLGMSVVAEGIETAAEAEVVADLDCEYGQGAYFNMALPAEELEKLF